MNKAKDNPELESLLRDLHSLVGTTLTITRTQIDDKTQFHGGFSLLRGSPQRKFKSRVCQNDTLPGLISELAHQAELVRNIQE